MAAPTPLLYNPASGGRRGARLAERAAQRLDAQGVPTRPVATTCPGDATRLARDLAEAGEPRLLVIGGDGTLSEAADGVLAAGRGTELGFLPGGTGNSFLTDFGMETLDAAVARVARQEPRPVDAGLVEWPGGQRHFINVFGIGFMAKVCAYANRRLKWLGARSYTAAVFPELARLKSPLTRVRVDGQAWEERLSLVAVCNTIHTGGAMRIAPMALPDDGLFDVIGLEAVSRMELLRLFPRIFDGSHVGKPHVVHFRGRVIELEPAESSPLLGDGEVYGATPVRVTMKAGALRAYV